MENYFSIIPTKLLLDKNIDDKTKLLCAYLNSFFNMYGEAVVSNSYIENQLGWSSRTIQRHIHKLCELGLIKVELVRNDKKQIIKRIISSNINYTPNMSGGVATGVTGGHDTDGVGNNKKNNIINTSINNNLCTNMQLSLLGEKEYSNIEEEGQTLDSDDSCPDKYSDAALSKLATELIKMTAKKANNVAYSYGYAPEFEALRKIYTKGGKKSAYTEWIKLNAEDRRDAYKYAKAYLDSVNDTKYVKNLENYLNSGTWETVREEVDETDNVENLRKTTLAHLYITDEDAILD